MTRAGWAVRVWVAGDRDDEWWLTFAAPDSIGIAGCHTEATLFGTCEAAYLALYAFSEHDHRESWFGAPYQGEVVHATVTAEG